MPGTALNRRFPDRVPRLAGRAWHDISRELQEFLNSLFDESQGIPAGFLGTAPLEVLVGETATPGLVTDGWMAAGAQLVTAAPTVVAALGSTGSFGASTTPAREDHVHKRAIEVSYNGVAVGIRRRLNFTTSGSVPTDDAVNDEIDVPLVAEDAEVLAYYGL